MSKDLTFEQAFEQLQEVVAKLESGKLTLEESLTVYKEGIDLSKYCEQKLKDAKASVVTVMKDSQEVPFNGEE